MCVVVAKYLKNGWVLAKNRDQDYVSTLTFLDESDQKVGEIFVLDDHKIKYREGMNHKGLVIITTSLTPVLSIEDNKSDGDNIYKALHMSDPEEAAKFLVSKKMTGYIFCATPEKLVLVEAGRKDDKKGKQGVGDYDYTIRVVPKTETIVRTNHGVDLSWAGFQSGYSDNQDMWRKSSESRKEIAEKVCKNAKTPADLLNALARWENKDTQLNVFRVENKPKQMRTIFQWALVPKEHTVYLRPIQTKMNVNVSKDKIQIEILDNEYIKKIYDGRIRHFTELQVSDDGTHIKSVQTESFLTFKGFLANFE